MTKSLEPLFKIIKKDKNSLARASKITTPHGEILTPAFSPVATRASVRGLTPGDLLMAKSQVILANTYHLFLRPGEKIIKESGGFGAFMGWDGPTITDSGGYQVSFIRGSVSGKNPVRITSNGAWFTSYINGDRHLLTPEKSMEIQKSLGADIIMAFDQPEGEGSFERTLKWEERSLIHYKKIKSPQALFGIVQGGVDRKLRRESMKFVMAHDFSGVAIGGKTIGSNPDLTAETLDTLSDLMPGDRPVHALGLGGGVTGILAAIERGIDLFDNTGITRMARTGLLFIYPEDGGTAKNKFRLDITRGINKGVKRPISKICDCYTCQNFSLGYLNHLMSAGEILSSRLNTIHNIHFINSLMEKIRNSIIEGNFSEFERYWQ